MAARTLFLTDSRRTTKPATKPTTYSDADWTITQEDLNSFFFYRAIYKAFMTNPKEALFGMLGVGLALAATVFAVVVIGK